MQFIRQDYYGDELKLFKQHHSHPGNWLIHAVTVPIEWLASLLLLLSLSGVLQPVVNFLSYAIAVYYLLCTKVRPTTILAAASHMVMAHVASFLSSSYSKRRLIFLGIAMHLLSWFLQVCIGHRFLERNSPSMLTKLTLNSVILSVLLAWDSKP
jgi:uncharacterized membrane protein YGL010W